MRWTSPTAGIAPAKLLQAVEDGTFNVDAITDLHAAKDFALMATKRAAQAMGKAVSFMVILQRHLWLNLADLKNADHKVLLNAPVTPSGLFGDAVESIIERFAEAQKDAKAMSHVMPRCTFQQQTARSRSSSAPGSSQRRNSPRPVTTAAAVTAPCQEPDVLRKVWGPGWKCHGQWRSRDMTLACRWLLSRHSDGLKRGGECVSSSGSQVPQVHMFPEVIPGISCWLLGMIEHGCTLQFRRRPPHFNGVVQSLTVREHRLRQTGEPGALGSHFVFPAPFQTGQLCSLEGTHSVCFSSVSSGFTTHAVMAEISSPLDSVDFEPFAHHGLQ
ncbi:hypothetical protein G5714_004694 [Onychostoma macrolepis]|uniref:Uncharacterized protein n=1 Tax=Onychostoma macrolepis TaxID=369639 RepID=A0A7J6D5F3_9TELE|nr:hypothetical protein G5714_004694 [Onychostoma macrolepis]